MEIMETTISLNSRKITCMTIYRPESLNIHKYTMYTFLSDFENLLTHYILTKDELIITGYFNFHMDKLDRTNIKLMNELFDTFDLIQHVTKPTHNCGNILDLIITKKTTKLFNRKVDEMLSDHHVLLIYSDMKKPPHPVKYITHRKLIRNLNMNQIKNDIIRGNGFLTIWFCLWSKRYQDHGFWLVCLHQLDLCVV